MRKLLPVGAVYWVWDCQGWNGYPFRVLYLGFWCIGIDRSKKYFARWPHIHIHWNDATHN